MTGSRLLMVEGLGGPPDGAVVELPPGHQLLTPRRRPDGTVDSVALVRTGYWRRCPGVGWVEAVVPVDRLDAWRPEFAMNDPYPPLYVHHIV